MRMSNWIFLLLAIVFAGIAYHYGMSFFPDAPDPSLAPEAAPPPQPLTSRIEFWSSVCGIASFAIQMVMWVRNGAFSRKG